MKFQKLLFKNKYQIKIKNLNNIKNLNQLKITKSKYNKKLIHKISKFRYKLK